MQREIRPRVSVTNEEIGAFYQEHRDEYEGKLRVRIIDDRAARSRGER